MSNYTEEVNKKKSWTKKNVCKDFLIIAAIFVVVIRIFTCFMESHKVDMSGYFYWSIYLNENSFSEFFSDSNLHVVYGPGYMYLLFLSGKISEILSAGTLFHEFLIKFWSMLADLTGVVFIYLIGKNLKREMLGFFVAILYGLNPGMIMNSGIWGQFDTFVGLFAFISIYLFFKNKSILAVVFYTISALTKPQTIFLFPLIVYLMFFQHLEWKTILPFFKEFSFKNILKYFNLKYFLNLFYKLMAIITTYTIMVLPFFKPAKQTDELWKFTFFKLQNESGSNILDRIIEFLLWFVNHSFKYSEDYPYATANGFNLWTLLGGQTVDDREIFFLGLSYGTWALIFLGITSIISLYIFINSEKSLLTYMFCGYFLSFSFFMVYSRIHERYNVPTLVLFAVCILWDRRLFIANMILAFTTFLNQYILYVMGNTFDQYWVNESLVGINQFSYLIAFMNILVFIYSIYYMFKYIKNKNIKHIQMDLN
jgi:Gpi18-like mannosyltransferase